MAFFERFETPGKVRDLPEAGLGAWNATVQAVFTEYLEDHPQFADPTASDLVDAATVPITWSAFPARLLRDATSDDQRWKQADGTRDEQDEYCEWSVERDGDGFITRVTFTSEVPEYWEHVAAQDREKLLALYREFVDEDTQEAELFDGDSYLRENPRNALQDGRVAHMIQGSNKLGAAVDLVARATILRERNGKPQTDPQSLVRCGGLGNELRNSDPQIAAAVNNAAAAGDVITLANPPGLYIDRLLITGIVAPDDANPAEFWHIERGEPGHVVRAAFEVTGDHDYRVGDLEIAGRKIAFGAQLADRVHVRATALIAPADHKPVSQPCKPRP